MNPIPLVFGALALARLVHWGWRLLRGQQPEDTVRSAPDDTIFAGWLGIVAIVSLLVVALTAGLGLLVVVPMWFVVAEPWWWGRRFAVPFGHTRLAYASGRLSTWVWRHDRRGGGSFASAWASHRAGTEPDPWVTSPPALVSVTAGMVSGAALLASSRGSVEDAASLLRASRWFDARPDPERAFVAEWLAAEAATRGDWVSVSAFAREPPGSPGCAFLAAVADRLLDREEAPDVLELERRFAALAPTFGVDPELPARRTAAALLDRARRARHRPTVLPPPLPQEPLAAALEAHRRALFCSDWLPEAASRWDAVEATLAPAVREQVAAELVARLAMAHPRPTLGGTMGFEVQDRVRQDGLRQLGVHCQALQERVKGQRDLDPMSEVRDFGATVSQVERLLSGADGEDPASELHRRAVLRAVYHPVTDWAAALYNRRRQPFLFRAVTWWLLELSRSAGDLEAVALYRRNLGVSRAWSAGRHRELEV